MKLLTQHELEKPMDNSWHHTTQGTWDGADPTPDTRPMKKGFIFPVENSSGNIKLLSKK